MVHKPIVIMIRDGWGYRTNPYLNGVLQGDDPYAKQILKQYPYTIIEAAGEAVGLPKGFQGNSEVGHMTIGSGRIFFQSMVKINKSITDGDFFTNSAFIDAIENCKKNKTKLHIIGLLQKEGVHAHIDHCLALIDTCKKNDFTDVLVHVISDGRDAPVNNTINNVKILLDKLKNTGVGKIASISGRFYAMDRDKRWERTRKAYDCVVAGTADSTFDDPVKCFEECYAKQETDEFIIPRNASWYTGVKANDSFIFYNYRTDRTRQLTEAIIEDSFVGWERKPIDVHYVCMTEFYSPMNKRATIAFPPEKSSNLLGEVISKAGLKQLRISETEKYAHVTFFFNGQIETPYPGEERILIPSPKVATYDLKPEMSVYEIGDRLIAELNKKIYDVIVVNFVNGDMVGHTGNWEAILKAVHAVDENVQRTCQKIIELGGVALVFADHGNCEDKTEEWRTSHTLNPVEFIVVSKDSKMQKDKLKLKEKGGLRDVAPTVLKLLGLEKPVEMTGESLI